MPDIYDFEFNKLLYRGIEPSELNPLVYDSFQQINSSALTSGGMSGVFTLVDGNLQSADFVTGSSGWQILSTGDVEFNTGTFRGSLVANSIDIPDTTTANSFHVNTTGDAWWGATAIGSATAKVLSTGVATFNTITIVSGVIQTGTSIVATLAGTLEQRANNIYDEFFFIGYVADGFTETTGGSSTITRRADATRLDAISDNGVDKATLTSGTFENTFDTADFEFICKGKVGTAGGGATRYEATMGVGGTSDAVITTGHVGFVMDEGVLKASSADGSTQETTTITGITITNDNIYRANWDATANTATFYVNDSLKATHSTNVPTGEGLELTFSSNSDGTYRLTIANNYSIRITPI